MSIFQKEQDICKNFTSLSCVLYILYMYIEYGGQEMSFLSNVMVDLRNLRISRRDKYLFSHEEIYKNPQIFSNL